MINLKNGFVIAIDGPAGAGKSTIAKKAAAALGFAYIDTGAMYRSVTWKLLQTGQPFSPDLAGRLAQEIRISFRPEGSLNRVFVDDTEVTEAIRSAAVTGLVSRVAAVPAVREAMVAQQRRMGREGNVVLDGRDIGTVVFPDSPCKIYLTASVEERARRRGKELEAKGQAVDYEKLQADIASRDKQDMERETSPLKQAEDAVYLDTSDMSIDEVTDAILKLAAERRPRA
ncbi:MAG: (d)CMP kinase [Succiniclasticum sp.]|nr:(d)CMP kinase [Succiniclasticum sp.]